jgi:hypothetical protein
MCYRYARYTKCAADIQPTRNLDGDKPPLDSDAAENSKKPKLCIFSAVDICVVHSTEQSMGPNVNY